MPANTTDLEKRLWDAADELRANSRLKSSEYSMPVLGLVENTFGSQGMLLERFPDDEYGDVPGLCKVATTAEIEEQGWSLNPGRYVGVAARAADDFVFLERLEELNEELETLNGEASELEQKIAENVALLLIGGQV